MKKTVFTPKPTVTAPASLDAFVGVEPQKQTGEKLKRLTIDISESLHRRVKGGCGARGVNIADLIRDFLEREFPPA